MSKNSTPTGPYSEKDKRAWARGAILRVLRGAQISILLM